MLETAEVGLTAPGNEFSKHDFRALSKAFFASLIILLGEMHQCYSFVCVCCGYSEFFSGAFLMFHWQFLVCCLVLLLPTVRLGFWWHAHGRGLAPLDYLVSSYAQVKLKYENIFCFVNFHENVFVSISLAQTLLSNQ